MSGQGNKGLVPTLSSLTAAIALLLAIIAANVLLPAAAPAQASASAHTTGYRWDAMRRLVGSISPDPDGAGALTFPAVRYTYDADGQLIRTEKGVLAAWQTETVLPVNWTGFTVQERLEVVYDAVGNKIEVRAFGSNGAVQRVTQMKYDANDRPLCSTVRMNFAAVPAATTDHCALGTAGVDGPDRVTKTIYDAAGQALQIRKAVGTPLEQAYVTYTYTSNGKQEFVIDANGNKAKMEYDGFDRQVKWVFPSNALPAAFNPANETTAVTSAGSLNTNDFEQYGYDANGNRTSLRKRDTRVITYGYDALNRMMSKTTPDAVQSVTYTYDLRGLQLSAKFTSSGLGVTSTYDKAGRLKTSTNTTSGTSRALAYDYDANGNRTRVTHPDTNSFDYVYDGLNRMTEVREGPTTVRVKVKYDNFGRRDGLDRVAGENSIYGYDPASRLNNLAHNFPGGTGNTATTFAYNPASQVKTREFSNDTYAYRGDVNVSRPYAKNGLNQYTSAGPASFTYDANGNLTGDGGTTYVYDVENRLTTATGFRNAQLTYDPLGRLASTAGGTAGQRQFLYDGDALVAEYKADGTLLRRYFHGPGVDEPLIWYEGANLSDPSYLHANHQGSIVALAKANGSLDTINSYDAWGIASATNKGRFQYTGQIIIPELEMYHYKARVYSPTLGRFLQGDPIGYEDQVNLYAYVGNDPVNGTDPTGETGKLINAGIKLIKHGGNPKKAGKEFIADVAEAGAELLDGDLTIGDAEAVFNLLSPVSTKEIKAGADAIRNVGKLPKPPTGKGSVPKDQRDPQRTFSPSQRSDKRNEQGGECATGCGTKIDETNSAGHHRDRHADGGRTTSENHDEVCIDCHRKLHGPN